MGQWVYRKPKSSIQRGICVRCKEKPQKLRSPGVYRSICTKCDKELYPSSKKYYKKKERRKSYCESCGFVPDNMCQLDLDHIDGNHDNNEKLNLQTLCANCHRLKTFKNEDWRPAGET